MGVVWVPEGEAPPERGLWADHVAAWDAWRAVSSQLRMVAVAGLGGAAVIWRELDHAAAEAGLRMAGIDVTPPLWAEVRAIEQGAIEELNRGR